VASDKTMFAMPETAIGLFPDVGGGFLLGQLESGIGAWLALVGAKLKAYDLVQLGLATSFVNSNEVENRGFFIGLHTKKISKIEIEKIIENLLDIDKYL
jgi:enoyl-CoA hydratase/carnithine racemase